MSSRGQQNRRPGGADRPRPQSAPCPAYLGSGLQLFAAGALITWLPTYLTGGYGMPTAKAALVAAAVIEGMSLGMVACGWATDRLSRSGRSGAGRPPSPSPSPRLSSSGSRSPWGRAARSWRSSPSGRSSSPARRAVPGRPGHEPGPGVDPRHGARHPGAGEQPAWPGGGAVRGGAARRPAGPGRRDAPRAARVGPGRRRPADRPAPRREASTACRRSGTAELAESCRTVRRG